MDFHNVDQIRPSFHLSHFLLYPPIRGRARETPCVSYIKAVISSRRLHPSSPPITKYHLPKAPPMKTIHHGSQDFNLKFLGDTKVETRADTKGEPTPSSSSGCLYSSTASSFPASSFKFHTFYHSGFNKSSLVKY